MLPLLQVSAALKGLNERLATTSCVAREYGDEEFSWQKNGYNRKDVLDDRVAFFVTQLMPGTHTQLSGSRHARWNVLRAAGASVFDVCGGGLGAVGE